MYSRKYMKEYVETTRGARQWPTKPLGQDTIGSMHKDASLLAQKCDKCQRFANAPKKPTEELVPIARPWPFA